MMTARPWTALPLALLALVAACNLIDGSGDGDGGPLPSTPTTDLARTAIDAHNQVRSHASPAPSPALLGVQWSAEVESVAQQWANHCVYEHNAARGNLGENIAASSPGVWPTVAGVVQAWASEVSDYDYASNSCAPGKVCGHYTQLVWRESTLIGCAYARCTENSPFPGFPVWDFWVCDYSPPGNWVGQRPY
jgi:pathogenesis-related protein 1